MRFVDSKNILTPSPGSLCYWLFWGGGLGVVFVLCSFVVCTTGRFISWNVAVLFVLVLLRSFWHCGRLAWVMGEGWSVCFLYLCLFVMHVFVLSFFFLYLLVFGVGYGL